MNNKLTIIDTPLPSERGGTKFKSTEYRTRSYFVGFLLLGDGSETTSYYRELEAISTPTKTQNDGNVYIT